MLFVRTGSQNDKVFLFGNGYIGPIAVTQLE